MINGQMMELVKEDNPILYKEAELYHNSDEVDLELLQYSMTKIIEEKGGIGLAAPQIGMSKRIFLFGLEPVMVINPEITFHSKETWKNIEGCLSFPNLFLPVLRFGEIAVTYKNIKGDVIEDRLNGTLGRVFQHELDHINGITFTKRVSRLVLNMAEKKRKKMMKKEAVHVRR